MWRAVWRGRGEGAELHRSREGILVGLKAAVAASVARGLALRDERGRSRLVVVGECPFRWLKSIKLPGRHPASLSPSFLI